MSMLDEGIRDTGAPMEDATRSESADEGGALARPLPLPAKRAFASLLTSRYITRSRNREAWEALLGHEEEIRARLDEMFLDLVLDRDLEVAFKRQQGGDDVPRVLRREKPLPRDASFLLIFLRRECAYADLGSEPAQVTREQIAEFLRTFRAEGDADEARFERRVDAAVNALVRPLGLLVPDPDATGLYTISPVVVPLIGVDEVQRLEAFFRRAAEDVTGTDGPPGDDALAEADAVAAEPDDDWDEHDEEAEHDEDA